METQDQLYKNSPAIAIERDPQNLWYVLSVTENISVFGYDHALFSSGRVDLLSLIDEQDHDIITRKLGGGILQKKDNILLRYRIRSGNSSRWVEDSCHITYNDDDTVLAASSVIWTTTLPMEWTLQVNGANTWNVLNSKVRHDILNQLTAVLGYLELSADLITDPMLREFTQKEQNAAERIREKLIFTREYQNIGISESGWQDLSECINLALSDSNCNGLSITVSVPGIRIFADKNFIRSLTNIFENVPLHAEGATEITVRYSSADTGGLLVIEDNGPGIADNLKTRIFDIGYGKSKGFGLFLAEKLLGVFGITIKENGIPGSSARFELTIPYEILSETPAQVHNG